MGDRNQQILENLNTLNRVVQTLTRLMGADGVARLPGGVVPASGAVVYKDENVKNDFLFFKTSCTSIIIAHFDFIYINLYNIFLLQNYNEKKDLGIQIFIKDIN